MYYIYVLRCSDSSLYTGITNNIKKRIRLHYYKQNGCAKYTRSHQVTAVERVWTVENKASALKLEHFLKSLTKQTKESLIIKPEDLCLLSQNKLSECIFEVYDISLDDIIKETDV